MDVAVVKVLYVVPPVVIVTVEVSTVVVEVSVFVVVVVFPNGVKPMYVTSVIKRKCTRRAQRLKPDIVMICLAEECKCSEDSARSTHLELLKKKATKERKVYTPPSCECGLR